MELLFENWRKYLNEDNIRDSLGESFTGYSEEQWAAIAAGDQPIKFNKFISKKVINILLKMKKEIEESTEMGKLLYRVLSGNSITPEEHKKLISQMKDIAGGGILLALFMIPGGGIWAPAAMTLAKKFNIDLMPSSFRKEESEVNERCQKGYKTHPKRKTKVMFGKKYRNCVKAEEAKEPKKGTGKKPKGSSRRLYTDENPSDTVSVKFKTVQDIKDTLSKESFKSKSHKRQSQIINLIHQRARAAYQNAKDPKTKARLKKSFEYAENRKEASKKKTQRMNKKK